MAARHFLKVTDEEINNIVSKKMNINFVQSVLVFQFVSLMFVNLDLLMTEVVECFVVCHWAVSCNKLTERHVLRAATNVIEVIRDGACQPRELYGSLIETFS